VPFKRLRAKDDENNILSCGSLVGCRRHLYKNNKKKPTLAFMKEIAYFLPGSLLLYTSELRKPNTV